MNVILGVDAGGTSSRAALFDLSGRLLRRGVAAGANPVAHGMERAAAHLTAAVAAVLGEVVPSQVVVGLAGPPGLCEELTARVFRSVPVRTVGDVVTAFAAGVPAASGTVLISGTGAIAAKIIDHVPVATADGYGWQLGDEGSAFWLGRAAARATIRALDRGLSGGLDGGLDGGLVGLVVRRLLPDGAGGDPVAGLAAAVQGRAPLALAELAPLVSRAAQEGDPVALGIVAEGAGLLVRTALEVHEPGSPIVLAGSVLTAEGPVRDSVRGLLEGATTSTTHAVPDLGTEVPDVMPVAVPDVVPVAVAGDPAGAAAWLAARPLMNPGEWHARHTAFVHPTA